MVEELNESIGFIDNKQTFYDGVLTGEIEYSSNLIQVGVKFQFGAANIEI